MCVSLSLKQTPPKRVAKKNIRKIVDEDSSSDCSCNREHLSLAEDVKRELARGNASWHAMRLYCPPFTCTQCTVYLWCIYSDGWFEWSA